MPRKKQTEDRGSEIEPSSESASWEEYWGPLIQSVEVIDGLFNEKTQSDIDKSFINLDYNVKRETKPAIFTVLKWNNENEKRYIKEKFIVELEDRVKTQYKKELENKTFFVERDTAPNDINEQRKTIKLSFDQAHNRKICAQVMREIMQSEGLTQRQAAAKADISKSQLNNILNAAASIEASIEAFAKMGHPLTISVPSLSPEN